MTLPRVHAVTDARVLAQPGFLDQARRIATLGHRAAIHLRDRTATGHTLANHAMALSEALRGSGTALIINARPDIAAAIAADGVQLGAGDLGVADARRVLPRGWVGRSVHSAVEGQAAAGEGADFLFAGTVFTSATHPGISATGPGFIRELASAGAPVIAIGGVTPERAGAIQAAGAWGIAAIRSIWDAGDPAEAALAMLEPWEGQ